MDFLKIALLTEVIEGGSSASEANILADLPLQGKYRLYMMLMRF